MLTEQEVLQALKQVEDPDLKQDIVSLGFVKNLIMTDAEVKFSIQLTTPACPVKEQLKEQSLQAVKLIAGNRVIKIDLTSDVKASAHKKAAVLPQVKNVIAVASGKGGVGKSTVAANLALALQRSGARVGLLDADIYGPSMPLMFGITASPHVNEEQQIVPIEKHGLKIMSMGFLSKDDAPVIWRGPMVHGIIQQFLTKVAWGELDYLVIDLPPGTGDAQLTLTQLAPLSGAVIVTTPQEVSLIDARKGLKMFQKVNVPILGIVENMSYYLDSNGKRIAIFGAGGGERTARELQVPFLGEIPIEPQVAAAGDQGEPIVIKIPDSAAGVAFKSVAGRVAQELSIENMKGPELPSDFKLAWKTK
ncbi:MAG: chromosome partitioning protein [Candidatus Omnitrophica bacterium CG11_big_fil_rev_8_21_14_0_20_45_26]|uniref:Iron-sulfur cluster carrier protein n=1 Tax=Candidatus Abzuiibacterium crystallinum TaxID=1974748 RepID=A0A2H0LL82_9BACT|nr:MAG: chromosome partitioning protein [Candidatus Omnitrophica bacterium CG11_big_fil_rev_8_21_14_0_20_45_26]PIW65379.1 MAG: chromosome partitioning protein [Candidatus Omnitrophica bacterium CG12_big_fil_rev_8_21_14_0_65_45_16]